MALKFSIVPPVGWKSISVDPARRAEEAREMTKAAGAYCSVIGLPADELKDFFNSFLSQAWNAGTRLAMIWAEEPSLLSSYTLSLIPPPHPGAGKEENLDAIVASAMSDRAELIDKESLNISSYSHPQLGEGVKVSEIRFVRKPDGGYTNVLEATLNIFLLVSQGCLLVTASTPSIEAHDILFELFTKITDSLRVESSPDKDASAA